MSREALVVYEDDEVVYKNSSEKRIQGPQQTRLKNIFNEEVSLVDFEKINMEYSLLNNEKMVGIKIIEDINNIPFPTINLEKKISELNSKIKKDLEAFEYSNNFNCNNILLTKEERASINFLNSALSWSKLTEPAEFKLIYDEINSLKISTNDSNEVLISKLHSLSLFIENEKNKLEPDNDLISFLEQFVIYQELQKKSYTQICLAADTALNNSLKYLTYTMPANDLSFEVKRKSVNIAKVMSVFETKLIKKISKSHFYIKLFMILSFYLGSISIINIHIYEFINKYYAFVQEVFKNSFVLIFICIFVFAFLFMFIFEGIENLVKYLNINERLPPSTIFFSFINFIVISVLAINGIYLILLPILDFNQPIIFNLKYGYFLLGFSLLLYVLKCIFMHKIYSRFVDWKSVYDTYIEAKK
ncbi:hypothetical protein [Acinetobacter sp. TGL-Y2]|uniref:hypothetical protein n=1 Tax=Acinetobacter sp. TGL-Y2 TaxID=1407071 RepID=UPI000AAF856E|nr:hypothetical protein [Acinetobacter sp. TGL-Y2]